MRRRVHSSVVRAADRRSAGPWFKSGCALSSCLPSPRHEQREFANSGSRPGPDDKTQARRHKREHRQPPKKQAPSKSAARLKPSKASPENAARPRALDRRKRHEQNNRKHRNAPNTSFEQKAPATSKPRRCKGVARKCGEAPGTENGETASGTQIAIEPESVVRVFGPCLRQPLALRANRRDPCCPKA